MNPYASWAMFDLTAKINEEKDYKLTPSDEKKTAGSDTKPFSLASSKAKNDRGLSHSPSKGKILTL